MRGGKKAAGNTWTADDVWGQVEYHAPLLLVLLFPHPWGSGPSGFQDEAGERKRLLTRGAVWGNLEGKAKWVETGTANAASPTDII